MSANKIITAEAIAKLQFAVSQFNEHVIDENSGNAILLAIRVDGQISTVGNGNPVAVIELSNEIDRQILTQMKKRM